VIHICHNNNGFSFNVKFQSVYSLLKTKLLLLKFTATLRYHKIGFWILYPYWPSRNKLRGSASNRTELRIPWPWHRLSTANLLLMLRIFFAWWPQFALGYTVLQCWFVISTFWQRLYVTGNTRGEEIGRAHVW
jgi:hypothetical protein